MRLEFDWDPRKEASDLAKHRVTFEEAMGVFRDPLARSVLDDDRGAEEECWVTLGLGSTRNLVMVCTLGPKRARIVLDPHYLGAPANPERGAPVPRESCTMKNEYDFSKAEGGKFHRPDAVLVPPVHLDSEVLAFVAAHAQARGGSLSELVNALLKKDIELIEAAQ